MFGHPLHPHLCNGHDAHAQGSNGYQPLPGAPSMGAPFSGYPAALQQGLDQLSLCIPPENRQLVRPSVAPNMVTSGSASAGPQAASMTVDADIWLQGIEGLLSNLEPQQFTLPLNKSEFCLFESTPVLAHSLQEDDIPAEVIAKV